MRGRTRRCAQALHFPFLRPRSLHTFAVSHFATRRERAVRSCSVKLSAVGKREAKRASIPQMSLQHLFGLLGSRALGVTAVW